jgi:DNA-binding HxlR family transcriptional regulator
VSGYGQFCPVAKTAEILGERWTFLIIRELLTGSHRFNDIHRGVPKMSRTLLSRRLRKLADSGIVRREQTGDGRVRYELTEAGLELRPVVEMIGAWGQRWLAGPLEDELDLSLLLWELRRTANGGGLAERTVRVRFDFTDHADFPQTLWEVAPDGRIEAFNVDPDRGADLVVRASASELAEIWLGRRSLVAAVAEDGPDSAPAYPAAYDGVIGVTAVDARLRVFDRARHGSEVDFAAPGVDVHLAGMSRYLTGTSHAAPFVTAALVLAGDRRVLMAAVHDLGPPGRDDARPAGAGGLHGPGRRARRTPPGGPPRRARRRRRHGVHWKSRRPSRCTGCRIWRAKMAISDD